MPMLNITALYSIFAVINVLYLLSFMRLMHSVRFQGSKMYIVTLYHSDFFTSNIYSLGIKVAESVNANVLKSFFDFPGEKNM